MDGSAGSTDGGVDAAADAGPNGPNVCGDGFRDNDDEECDDGPGSAVDSCDSSCRVQDVLVGPGVLSPDVRPPPGRYLGEGRHTVAASSDGFAVVFVEPEPSPAIRLRHFGAKGEPGATITVSSGSSPVLFANPVVAALPGSRFAVAWTDFSSDGDELGIGARIVTVSQGSLALGALTFANAGRDFSQLDADILWTGSELVVAWVDLADAATAPDLRLRRFSATFVGSSSQDETLAATASSETNVALSRFGSSWAAAFRSATGGSEIIRARAGTIEWSVGPFLPAPADDHPALAELDSGHLLLVFTEGTDPGSTGVANTPRLRAAILDVAAPGLTASFELTPARAATAAPSVALSHPNLVRGSDGRLYIAWRSSSLPGDPAGEELWLHAGTWSAANSELTLEAEIALPRAAAHSVGDQRFPALVAAPLWPSGALATAWTDFGRTFGGQSGAPDVVAEFIPTPVLRLDGAGVGE
jgi:hypothetical protein